MPGAWELSGPDTLVAILTRGIVPTAWSIGFRHLQFPANSNFTFLTGMPFEHARNAACDRALKQGYQWLFFLDDDVVCPPDTINRLKGHGKDVVSGIYYRRQEPIKPVALRWKQHEGKRVAVHIEDFTPGEVVEADIVGAGCLLIHRRVLEEVGAPWFEWLLDPFIRKDIPDGERVSEDFDFCNKAKAKGFRVFLDTGIQCQHIGHAQSEIGGKYSPVRI